MPAYYQIAQAPPARIQCSACVLPVIVRCHQCLDGLLMGQNFCGDCGCELRGVHNHEQAHPLEYEYEWICSCGVVVPAEFQRHAWACHVCHLDFINPADCPCRQCCEERAGVNDESEDESEDESG